MTLRLCHPCLFLVHTEYVDYFVALSRQESASKGAAERVSGALVQGGLPVLPVTCSSLGETLGWEFDPTKPVVVVSRTGVWRLRLAMLHVASLGWASQDEKKFFGWSLHVSSSGAESSWPPWRCLRVLSTRWPRGTATVGACRP